MRRFKVFRRKRQMTTHLHPIDKLPIIDTPLTNALIRTGTVCVGGALSLCEDIEIRARTAEAQLAVAVKALHASWPGGFGHEVNEFNYEALAEIAAIGGEE
jgi:hypothetical protein